MIDNAMSIRYFDLLISIFIETAYTFVLFILLFFSIKMGSCVES